MSSRGVLPLMLLSSLFACGDDGGDNSTAFSGSGQTSAVTTVASMTMPAATLTAATPTTGDSLGGADDTTDSTSAAADDTGDDDSFPGTSVASLTDPGDTSDTGFDPNCANILQATVRDFKVEHPDFEYMNGEDPGIVLYDLGPDDKPVYAGQDGNWTTNGQVNFDQWYRDVPGINLTSSLDIPLVAVGNGQHTYDNAAFFPIDGQGWGNEGNPHNYHFTVEIHTTFDYKGGEVFTFRGDDDVFVFINRKLAIDLGGVHNPAQMSVDLDQTAGQLGITPGNSYPIDFFFAERHTTASNFRIETTIKCLQPPG